MATSTEILSRIESGPNHWNERVLLARYAWVTDDVVITNKAQVILNLLIGRLVSHDQQKLSVEETKVIFETVCDMLCSELSATNDTLILPTRFSNFLLSQLRHFMEWNRNMAFRCVCAIFRSKALQVLFSVHINKMNELLALMIAHYLKESDEMAKQSLPVLELIADQYFQLQKKKTQRVELIGWLSSHLLSPVLLFWKRFEHDVSHKNLLSTLHLTICDILFASESHKQLVNHISIHVHRKKSPDADAKCFVLFRKTVTAMWSSPVGSDEKQAIVAFIPWFYEQSILKSNGSKFDMLQYSMTTMGVQINDDTNAYSPDGDTVVVIERLLSIVIDHDVYDMASDNENKKLIKNWLEKLINLLLDSKVRETKGSAHAAWFQCLLHFLELNYELIFKNMTRVWKHCWIDTIRDNEVTALRNQLFTRILKTYCSLSQTEKFLNELLKIVRLVENQICCSWPDEFLESFGKVTMSLNIGQVKVIWAAFVDELSEYYINKELNQVLVSQLFYEFLNNIQIPDYNMAAKTTEDVTFLMKRTLNEVINVWTVNIVKEKRGETVRQTFLMLSSVWAELRILLHIYGRECDWLKLVSIDDVTSNMNCIVPVYYPNVWNDVIENVSSPTERYFIGVLWCQKIKASLLTVTDSNTEAAMAVVKEGIRNLSRVSNQRESDGDAWNGKLSGLNEKNYPIAQWRLLLESLTQVVSIPQETLLTIVKNIVDSITESTPKERSLGSGVTQYSLSQQFLKGEVFEEAPWLHFNLVTDTWLQINTVLVKALPKKCKAGKEMLTTFITCLKENGAMESKLCDFHGPVKNKLIAIWDSVRQSSVNKIDADITVKLGSLFQILSSLPLQSLSSDLLSLCVLGLLLVLNVIIPSGEDVYSPSDLDFQTLPALLFNLLRQCWNRETFTLLFAYPNSTCLDASAIFLLAYTYFNKQLMLSKDADKSLEILENYRRLVGDISKMVFMQYKKPEKFFEVVKQGLGKRGKILRFWSQLAIRNSLAMMKNTQKNSAATSEIKSLHDNITDELLHDIPKMNVPVEMLPAVLHVLSACLAKFKPQSSQTAKKKSSGNADDAEMKDDKSSVWLKQISRFTKLAFHSLSDVGMAPDLVCEACLSYIMTLTKTLSQDSSHNELILDLVPDDFFRYSWSRMSQFKAQLHIRSLPDGFPKTGDVDEKGILTDNPPRESSIQKDAKFLSLEHKLNLLKRKSTTHHDTGNDGEPAEKKSRQEKTGSISASPNSQKFLGTQYDLSDSSLHTLKSKVEEIMAVIVNNCDEALSTSILNSIHQNMSSTDLNSDYLKVIAAIDEWECLLKFVSSESELVIAKDKKDRLSYLSREVLVSYQHIMQSTVDIHCPTVRELITISVLQSIVRMLSLEMFLPVNAVHLCLNCIHHTSLCEDVPIQTAAKYIPIVYSILNLLLNNNASLVMEMKPAYLGCCKKFLSAVIYHSNQATIQKSDVDDMLNCAHLVEKLLTNISYHNDEFCRVAFYIISNYVFEVQKVTLVPSIKRALLPGIYAMLRISDDKMTSSMFTVLEPGIKEVLKGLFADYNKYHKYTGLV